jgi:pyruvate/2-oxoglutarate/acetoin dehydrogenase E1 component
LEVQKMLPEVSLEIIDLRTLLPWDEELVFESVKKTGKCIVVHEDCLTGGIGGEMRAACMSSSELRGGLTNKSYNKITGSRLAGYTKKKVINLESMHRATT